ncbi:MAG: hypothetical protein AB1656_20955 [Candidatus Omnitrophota bacterium]
MIRICAWCGKEMGEAEGSEEIITHGICASCVQNIAFSKKRSLRAYLNKFEFPILLVDDNVVVKIANNLARKALGKDLREIEGYFGGEAIECVYASQPGGCGKTVHCKACTIRLVVNETYATGKSILGRPAYQDIMMPEGVKQIALSLSTEKVGEFVILRIND